MNPSAIPPATVRWKRIDEARIPGRPLDARGVLYPLSARSGNRMLDRTRPVVWSSTRG